MLNPARIVFCHCRCGPLASDPVTREVHARLVRAGVAFDEVADLCEMAERRDALLREISRAPCVKIAACYPRAVKWLFFAAGAPLCGEGVEVVNLRAGGVEEIVGRLLGPAGRGGLGDGGAGAAPAAGAEEGTTARTPAQPAPGAAGTSWIPWFPVIDYSRCKNCKQCLSFCLFDVYGLSPEGKVEVRSGRNCKTNCPACARVCPEAAIIFPKYDAAPINGDEVADEDLHRESAKAELSSILGGDVYAALRQRSQGKRRFATEADAAQAPPEREELQEPAGPRRQPDAPTEVLMSLRVVQGPRETCGCKQDAPPALEEKDHG